MMNNVCIMGRFTADPVLKMSKNNRAVTTFTVAVAKAKDKADFIDCTAWEASAKLICRFGKKGGRIALSGPLETSTWKDKDGIGRKSYFVRVEQFNVIDYEDKGETEPEAANGPADDTEELPF